MLRNTDETDHKDRSGSQSDNVFVLRRLGSSVALGCEASASLAPVSCP